jgi:hypothetical protein
MDTLLPNSDTLEPVWLCKIPPLISSYNSIVLVAPKVRTVAGQGAETHPELVALGERVAVVGVVGFCSGVRFDGGASALRETPAVVAEVEEQQSALLGELLPVDVALAA